MEGQVNSAPVVDVESAGNMIAEKMDAMSEPKEEITEPSSEVSDTEEAQPDATEEQEDSQEDSAESNEEPETEEPEEESTETFDSITDLAEATGMEIDDFLETVKQKVKINGEEMEVSLKDLTAGYQMEQDYRRKTTELSEQRKGFEAEKEQATTHIQSKLQEADAITANLEQQLMGDYNAIDWNQLEIQDREEWLVQRQKFSEKAQQLETSKAQIKAEMGQYQQQAQAKQQEAFQAHLIKENEALLQAIPEWTDNTVREAATAKMTDYLSQYGFSEQESSQISDHRIMRLINDAVKGANTNQKIDVVKKKVKTLPKIVKPSAKVDKQAAKKRAGSDSWNKYKQSGSMDDLTAHLASKL